MPRAALGVAAGAGCAQHTAGNFDNRQVEIVCAASARVNVSVLYQFVDTGKRPWPTSVAPRQGIPVGQRVARSLPERWPAHLPRDISLRVQGHQLAHRGGAAWSLPLSNREREWTPRHATLLCSPPCHSSAQASPGSWIT